MNVRNITNSFNNTGLEAKLSDILAKVSQLDGMVSQVHGHNLKLQVDMDLIKEGLKKVQDYRKPVEVEQDEKANDSPSPSDGSLSRALEKLESHARDYINDSTIYLKQIR